MKLLWMAICTASVAIIGCDNGGPSAKKGTGLSFSVEAPQPGMKGTFETIEDQSGQSVDPHSCDANFEFKLDSKLKPNQTFEMYRVDMEVSGDYTGMEKQSIKVLSVNHDEQNWTYRTSFLLSTDQFAWFDSKYKMSKSDDGQVNYENEIEGTSESLKPYMNESDEVTWIASCFSNWSEGEPKVEREVLYGEYTFADGKKVPAYKITTTETGRFSCTNNEGESVDQGNGTQVSVQIVSPSVPTIQAPGFSCSPNAPIYEYSKTTLESGEVAAHKKFEIEGGDF